MTAGGGKRCTWILFLLCAALALALDLGSKYTVFGWVASRAATEGVDPERGEIEVFPNLFGLHARYNNGGMWSLGHAFGATTNQVLAAFSAVAAVGIVAWAYWGCRPGERLFPALLGMILGGALGNLYDRLVFGGVRDFLHVHYYEVYHYPTFNLADSFLVCGALALVLLSLFAKPAVSLPT